MRGCRSDCNGPFHLLVSDCVPSVRLTSARCVAFRFRATTGGCQRAFHFPPLRLRPSHRPSQRRIRSVSGGDLSTILTPLAVPSSSKWMSSIPSSHAHTSRLTSESMSSCPGTPEIFAGGPPAVRSTSALDMPTFTCSNRARVMRGLLAIHSQPAKHTSRAEASNSPQRTRRRVMAPILAGGSGQDKLPFDTLLQSRSGPATMRRWR